MTARHSNIPCGMLIVETRSSAQRSQLPKQLAAKRIDIITHQQFISKKIILTLYLHIVQGASPLSSLRYNTMTILFYKDLCTILDAGTQPFNHNQNTTVLSIDVVSAFCPTPLHSLSHVWIDNYKWGGESNSIGVKCRHHIGYHKHQIPHDRIHHKSNIS